jgi:hypothetical protein
MKNTIPFAVTLLLVQAACSQPAETGSSGAGLEIFSIKINSGKTIATRFDPPEGFERREAAPGTFAAYLRSLPLKPEGSPVHLYNGNLKSRQDVHAAVIDMDAGERDLQQCADAVMRLRAEFLFAQKKYDDIHFNFTNGFRADYGKWRRGERIIVEGNRASWRSTGRLSTSYEDFRAYLVQVFTYAGTLSLERELKKVPVKELEIGDVFIRGGSPGHAVIVVDAAVNPAGKKVFLLAQSYMPAQEIHVLKNPDDQALSPWYSNDFDGALLTPEWRFSSEDLKRF